MAALAPGLPAQNAIPTLRTVREVVIDGAREEAEFTHLMGACTLGNGVLVTLSDLANLRLWSPRGALLHAVGRKGAGPGEFTAGIGLGCTTERIWVFDRALSRISSFDTEGQLLATQAVRRNGIGVLLPDGATAVMPTFGFSANPAGLTRVRFDVIRVADGEPARVLFLTSTHYRVLNVPAGEDRMIVGPQPFDDGGLWDFSADGTTFVFVDRSVEQATFQVTAISWQGDTLFRRSYPYRQVRLSKELVEKEARSRIADNSEDLLPAYRKALATPTWLATVSRVVVGTDGTIWLRRENTGQDRLRWTVLDRTGTPFFEVLLPGEFGLLEASAVSVQGVLRDRDDVPSLVRYRLVPKRTPD